MRRLILNFDCDNVIADTPKAILDLYREITNDYSTELTDLKSWSLQDICPKMTKDEINDLFINPRLFELLQPTEGVISTLQYFKDLGHTVNIVTLHNPLGIPYKNQWLEKHFGFVDDIIYCRFNPNKRMGKNFITHDVIIDDNTDVLETSECIYKICYGDYPYNQNWMGFKANNMQEIRRIIANLSLRSDMSYEYLM